MLKAITKPNSSWAIRVHLPDSAPLAIFLGCRKRRLKAGGRSGTYPITRLREQISLIKTYTSHRHTLAFFRGTTILKPERSCSKGGEILGSFRNLLSATVRREL
jgi:hypothetical protein